MEVFKFGGASVKDAPSVKNVVAVLNHTGAEDKVVVVSAMGKMTNAFEVVVASYLEKNRIPKEQLSAIKNFHLEIASQLFEDSANVIYQKIDDLIAELINFLEHNKSTQYDFVYDQIVCYGELLSSVILSEYFSLSALDHTWLDARKLLRTDSTYRDATINWPETQEKILAKVRPGKVYLTQGFIGADANNFTTTLGREGSDYTAAIFAYCLNAEKVTIWKDVPGVLNADPRVFRNTTLLNQISYEEAIELAFYGASVIHPKTLQPLQRKEIPLFVKSFIDPKGNGTAVSKGQTLIPAIPCFIVKKNQVLISLSSLDFSFMVEENISEIFRLFHLYQMKVDLIQNSAISFAVCVDNKFNNLEKLILHLKARFKVDYIEGVSLYTIRHFDEAALEALEKDKEVLLKQVMQNTVQLVTRA
ncbi:aspartate kinase [Antarcticibacterium flavum]|uniref:Aspartokinase n=1 Tax=Antarcticibacterium flavum TaxID=2058175 RepID=A0A5B7X183_9FLAO|nr:MULTISPECIES: aspartate kinase [Antarcticibacterium]MCM4161147.1 aspartate kinase [Antarcticibacterium sp. W02-3]QCY69354.1 aspartate kinase [Antarcticibacterium flavum]